MASWCRGVGLGLAVGVVLALTGCSRHGTPEGPHGAELLFKQQMPAEALQRIREFNLTPINPRTGKPKAPPGLLSDTEDWRANRAVPIESRQGPYRIVLVARGRATASGEALMHWDAMWSFDGVQKGSPALLVSQPKVSAGEDLTLVLKAPPLRFEKSGEALPVAGFIRAENFDIRSVELQVWQGVEPTGWREMLLSFPTLLVGLVFGALAWRVAFR